MQKKIVIPIIAVAVLLQWYSHHGALFLTSDSYHYLAASQSFSNSLSFLDKKGDSFLFWPPLFPVILSFLGPVKTSLAWINTILTIGIALTILNISKCIIDRTPIRILYFIFILLGVHLLLISVFLWSELIFLFLAVIFVDQLQRSKEHRASFYIAIFTGFLMCLQRNAGIFIVGGAAIWIFINEENVALKIARSSAFFLCVVSGLAVWTAYVWLVKPHEHFRFSEELFQHTLANTNALAHGIVTAYFPIKIFSIPILAGVLLFLFFFLKEDLKENLSLQLTFIITVSYLFFLNLIVIINIAGFPIDDGEGDRFISVIIPFFSILIFKAFDKVIKNQNTPRKIFILALLSCWMIYPLARTAKNSMQWHKISANRSK